MFAGARIDRAFGALRGGGRPCEFFADFAAGTETWIDQAGLPELIERAVVSGRAGGLAERGFVPVETEPLQVGFDALIELVSDSRTVDVLVPKQEDAAG